jgi:hypothetical protein
MRLNWIVRFGIPRVRAIDWMIGVSILNAARAGYRMRQCPGSQAQYAPVSGHSSEKLD